MKRSILLIAFLACAHRATSAAPALVAEKVTAHEIKPTKKIVDLVQKPQRLVEETPVEEPSVDCPDRSPYPLEQEPPSGGIWMTVETFRAGCASSSAILRGAIDKEHAVRDCFDAVKLVEASALVRVRWASEEVATTTLLSHDLDTGEPEAFERCLDRAFAGNWNLTTYEQRPKFPLAVDLTLERSQGEKGGVVGGVVGN